MAPGIWSLTFGLVLGIGQFGAVDLPWFWGAAIDETVAAETLISPTLGGHIPRGTMRHPKKITTGKDLLTYAAIPFPISIFTPGLGRPGLAHRYAQVP